MAGTTEGYVFVARGDITRMRADAIVYSTSVDQHGSGHLVESFRRIPGFDVTHPKIESVGDTFWLPAAASNWLYGVVGVAVAGGARGVGAEEVACATTNAIAEAVRRLDGSKPRLGPGGVRRLVALPSLGTGSGGANKSVFGALALAQVTAAWDSVRTRDDLDVVLVAYDDVAHARLLDARRQVIPTSGATQTDPDLFRALREGTCVPFLGAGVSHGCGLPLWKDLLVALYQDCGVTPDPKEADSLRLAQTLKDHVGSDHIREALRSRLGADRTGWGEGDPSGCHVPSLSHYLLLQLRFPFVVTTNYDHLVEHAVRALRDRPRPVVLDDDVSSSGGPFTTIVKLHGCAGESSTSGARGIVLTSDEYQAFPSAHPAKVMLLQALLLNRHFLFVGYGLGDETLRTTYQAIANVLSDTQRQAFVTSVTDPGDVTTKYPKLQVISIGEQTGSTAQRVRQLAIWLDGLAASVLQRRGRPFLGSSAPPTKELRDSLVRVGRQMEVSLQREELEHDEALALIPLIEALERSGYRLHGTTMTRGARGPTLWSDVWRGLARRVVGDPAGRRALLERALASADRAEDIDELEREVRALAAAERAS